MRNGVWSRRKCPLFLSSLSLVLSQMPYRLISRFFLNLRAICYYGQTTAANQTVVSTMTSPIRTHPFWRRPRQFTTTFSFRFGTGARTYGDLATRTERGIPHTETVDLESVMVLSTRQDENKGDIRLDVVTMDKK